MSQIALVNDKRVYGRDITAPNYSHDTSTYLMTFRVRRVGNVCTLSVTNGRTNAISASTTIFTLPAGYRPTNQVEVVDTCQGIRMMLNTSGNVSNAATCTDNKILRFTMAYITTAAPPTGDIL